jgi:hypothetical protein
MLYFIVFIEIAITLIFLYLRLKKYQDKKLLINPKNELEDSHNLVKSGKTKRLVKERDRFINSMVIILAIGLVILSATLFRHYNQVVKQHRKDGLISIVLIDEPSTSKPILA